MIKKFLYMLLIIISGQGLCGRKKTNELPDPGFFPSQILLMGLSYELPSTLDDYFSYEKKHVTDAEIKALEQHEAACKRWSSRQAWCGAVIRAGLYTRATAKKPLIYSMALGRFVDGTPDVGKPSDRESELK